MASQHQGIWTQCRDRRGVGLYQNQSWPDDTCFDASLLPSEIEQVSGILITKTQKNSIQAHIYIYIYDINVTSE